MRHDKNTCVGCTHSRTHRIARHVASSIHERHHSSGDHIITLIVRVSSTLSDSSMCHVGRYIHVYRGLRLAANAWSTVFRSGLDAIPVPFPPFRFALQSAGSLMVFL